MKAIAVYLRTMQFIAHRAHIETHGSTFFEDHKFLGKAYEEYQSAYDAVIERMKGLGEQPDINAITLEAAETAAQVKDTIAVKLMKCLYGCEITLCKLIKHESPKVSVGTQNRLAGIADESEVRQYKLKQRTLP